VTDDWRDTVPAVRHEVMLQLVLCLIALIPVIVVAVWVGIWLL